MRRLLLSILFLFFSLPLSSAEYSQDLLTSLRLMRDGSLYQFTTVPGATYFTLGTAGTLWSLGEDKRLALTLKHQKISPPERWTSVLSIAATFPILPLALREIGLRKNNEKLYNFSIEYFSALYLGLIEAWALSQAPMHKRPDEKELNFFETAFRGSSSYPSGHSMAFTILAFKTLQYYGPLISLPAFTLTYLTMSERVKGGKHYTSDVVGAFFISGMASEGVRRAAKYSHNHSFYKKWLEHDINIGIARQGSSIGPMVVFNY